MEGFRDIALILENQLGKDMGNKLQTGLVIRIFGSGLELGFGFGLAYFEFRAFGRLATDHLRLCFEHRRFKLVELVLS